MASSNVPPFHRLLSFYSNRNPYDSQTIRLQDSIAGNLALGLDFPVALSVAIGRHLFLKNTGLFSLQIHVPSVSWKTTPLEELVVDEKKEYSRREIQRLAMDRIGLMGFVEATGFWALAADVKTGLLRGSDVEAFRKGTVFQELERRRKDRSQVLPLWRGGPISVAGHSWAVEKIWGVQVYQDTNGKED